MLNLALDIAGGIGYIVLDLAGGLLYFVLDLLWSLLFWIECYIVIYTNYIWKEMKMMNIWIDGIY